MRRQFPDVAGMNEAFCIGLDFGTASARGVLIDVETGHQIRSAVHSYRHGTLSATLAGQSCVDDAPKQAQEAAPATMTEGRYIK
jgi:ribulose kinase